MKKEFKTFLSILLAASVLFASTGIVIASHICLKKQIADVSLFESKGCCAMHHERCSTIPVVKKKCCQLSVSYHKLELNTETKSPTTFTKISIPGFVIDVPSPVLSSLANTFTSSDDPPVSLRLLPGSKNFLFSIRLLLI
jgi:hypothetical protein